jgi:hypothetical protein
VCVCGGGGGGQIFRGVQQPVSDGPLLVSVELPTQWVSTQRAFSTDNPTAPVGHTGRLSVGKTHCSSTIRFQHGTVAGHYRTHHRVGRTYCSATCAPTQLHAFCLIASCPSHVPRRLHCMTANT